MTDLRTERRGALPRQTWRRHSVAELRIGRLLHDVTVERDRHPESGKVYGWLSGAVRSLGEAVTAATAEE